MGVNLKIRSSAMRAAIVVILALLMAGLAISTISMLTQLEQYQPPHVTESILARGQIFHLFLAEATWQNFPALPFPLMNYLDLPVFVFVAMVIAAVFLVNRYKLRVTLTTSGLLALAFSLTPCFAGMMFLSTNSDAGASGPWLAAMILSILYGSLACSLFAGLDVMQLVKAKVLKKAERRAF
jgi:ABC-type sulfate transport system permease subunit